MNPLHLDRRDYYMSPDDSESEGLEVEESVGKIASLKLNSSNESLSSLEFAHSPKEYKKGIKKEEAKVSLLSAWEVSVPDTISPLIKDSKKKVAREKAIDFILQNDSSQRRENLSRCSVCALLEMETELVEQQMKHLHVASPDSGLVSEYEKASEARALRIMRDVLFDKGVGIHW
jgi:hypothetical protein